MEDNNINNNVENNTVEENLPIRIKQRNWPIIVAVLATLLVILFGYILWITLSVSHSIIAWGPEEITFYSQKPFREYGTEEFFENGENIDGGFNESVYLGSKDYFKFKNDKLKMESQLGIAQSMVWSESGQEYISDYWGLDAQYKAGADVIVSSGFNIAIAFDELYSTPGFTDEEFMQEGKRSIVIDDSMLAPSYQSATSVTFDGAGAGFIAGLAASVYTMSQIINGSTTNDDTVIWGGEAFDTVYEWMSGFEQGVNYFNYRVLGVDVTDVLGATGEYETYDYLNKKLVTDEDYTGGIDVTNGGTLVAGEIAPGQNYNSSFEVNNSEFSSLDDSTEGNYWYTGSFDVNVNEGAGKYAESRSQDAIMNGVQTIFPVAGGQTMIASSVIGNSTNTTTKVIGVDVDGTQVDSSNASAYLGSATKNLRDSAALALWSVDKELNPDKKFDKKEAEFGGIKGEDFESVLSDENPKGWKVDYYSESGVEPKGNLYMGTYENGGVGFTEGIDVEEGMSALDIAYEIVAQEIMEVTVQQMPSDFHEFVRMAYDENMEYVGVIENTSTTFAPKYLFGTETSPITLGSEAVPWIPNWELYVNTHNPTK